MSVVYGTTANVAGAAIQNFLIGPSLSNRIGRSNSNRISKLRRSLVQCEQIHSTDKSCIFFHTKFEILLRVTSNYNIIGISLLLVILQGSGRTHIRWRKYFFPRDAMHKCGLCHHVVSVSPSIPPSVMLVDSVDMNKHIFKIFHYWVVSK